MSRPAIILELGCGTGEDALYLAGRGVRVTATDASPAMLAVARAKTADQPLVFVQPLDLNALPADFPAFDGVFANFGVLNCLTDWRPLAAWLAQRIPPGESPPSA
ncbi:MAG: class I SAM-dependent methyltransferase [Anaerolineae bacterium]